MLMAKINVEDTILYSYRSPREISPDPYVPPYEIVNLTVLFIPLQPLICWVYNAALEHGIFPTC